VLAIAVASRSVKPTVNHRRLLALLGNAKAGLPWSTNEVMGLIIDFLKNALR
jgi:hypothetical protein